ncbi:unnamed protein product [Boreogadus saida]
MLWLIQPSSGGGVDKVQSAPSTSPSLIYSRAGNTSLHREGFEMLTLHTYLADDREQWCITREMSLCNPSERASSFFSSLNAPSRATLPVLTPINLCVDPALGRTSI